MRLIQEGTRRPGGVMIVGEAPGETEIQWGRPFVGASGHELDSELGLAGWNRAQFSLLTNVCHERPPGNEIDQFFAKKSAVGKRVVVLEAHDFDHVIAMLNLGADPYDLDLPELALVAGRYPTSPILHGLLQLQADLNQLRPSLIIALGNTALWALTGLTGITNWRGSILEATGGPVEGHGCKLIPTMHPAAVVREYTWRTVAIQDLKRAKRESAFPEVRKPAWRFHVPKTVREVEQWLGDFGLARGSSVSSSSDAPPITADVENHYEEDAVHNGRLICLGFAANKLDAMCVPFVHRGSVGEDSHWWQTPEEEVAVTMLCRDALRTRSVIFHNGLHDTQILARNWDVMPAFKHDTMMKQHVAWPGMFGGKLDPLTGKSSKKGSSLSLAFCSSMYCEYHRFWKNDGRGWDATIHDEMQYFRYNCEDCVRTLEVSEELDVILKRDNLWETYLFEMELFEPVFEMMFRGMVFDETRRRDMRRQVKADIEQTQAWIDAAVGHPLNVGSAPQMQNLFYHDFQVPPVLHRKTKKPTLDDKALETISKRKPILRPLIEKIQGLRSLGVFGENFLSTRTSKVDGRLRAALNPVGPETFRFSSNVNAFGEGMNLQNLPRD